MRILGVDPGSHFTGYGCVDLVGQKVSHVTHGTLSLKEQREEGLPDRLWSLFQKLNGVIQEFKPQVLSIEKIFFAKNALSALTLGHARGVILLSARMQEMSIVEYAPTEVKQALVGRGHAGKEEVARVIQWTLGPQIFETPDASDGLALAICHAYCSQKSYLRSRTTSLSQVAKGKS